MRLTAITLALLSLTQAVNAYRPRKPDESVLIDNMYFDPTEPGETVFAKYATPFDPPRTYGTICKEELEGTWEQWEGGIFLMAPGGTGKVHNELSPEFLKAAGEELDPKSTPVLGTSARRPSSVSSNVPSAGSSLPRRQSISTPNSSRHFWGPRRARQRRSTNAGTSADPLSAPTTTHAGGETHLGSFAIAARGASATEGRFLVTASCVFAGVNAERVSLRWLDVCKGSQQPSSSHPHTYPSPLQRVVA